MTDWTELMVTIDTDNTEIASAIAQVVAGGGIYIEDYSDLEEQVLEIARIDLIDDELLAKDRTKSIIHIYIAPDISPAEHINFIGARLTEADIPFSISTASVKELDWATAWKQYYHPISLSDKIAICPSWEDYTPKDGQKVIKLDPGMAFGTGTHETTKLCLLQIEKFINDGDSVLDIGCGSGILAICAKLLGAGQTIGIDIDTVAVRTAKENCKDNNCDIEILCGDLAKDVNEKFDLICANIVADAIILLLPEMPSLLKQDGRCILSGIITERKDDVLDKITELDLNILSIVEDGGWVAIVTTLK